jgi:PAS domain S-box-containing protein
MYMADVERVGSLRDKLRNIPLRYRLSIPFFFLAFMGTTLLVGLAIISQNKLIQQEEQERLFGYHRALDYNIELQGRWAVSLASSFARNPEVSHALAARDRLRLIQLCYPAYTFMREHYGISQFNFHELPPRNFLRLQRLYEFGDDLGYRQTILDTVTHQKETFGLEKGITGYGIRGVAPVFHEGEMVGTIEIGFSFGNVFLEQMKYQFGTEVSFLVPVPNESSFESLYTTFKEGFKRNNPVYTRVYESREPEVLLQTISDEPYVSLVRTVEDYKGKTVELVEFSVNRTETLEVIDHYLFLMLGLGGLGMLISVGAIYIISAYFIRPIGKMVLFAREIAQGMPVGPLSVRPAGELKVLADALNDMFVSLEESKEKIQDYTDNLEYMVLVRTRALRESEEKFRTLVENVPLVVYRLLGTGKTIFINHFIEDLTGISHEKALENRNFWVEKVWEEDRERIWPLMERCLKDGHEFKAEYRMLHTSGKLVYVLDHALPVFDEKGSVETVDGFLVDVTDRHCLQQQIIQTEELRTLSEVSARLAHEIRNPLVAAGGFARRLLQNLSEGDPNREKVQIIVREVARLEKILEKTLAYLRPFEISAQRCSLNELVVQVINDQEKAFEEHAVRLEVKTSTILAPISLDQVLFKKALESILLAMLDMVHAGGEIEVRTYPGDNAAHVEMSAKGTQISEDDIDHFFYPFTSRTDHSKSLDLPLAKMIIHKHQGLILLRRKNSDRLTLNISLPQ